MEADSVALLEWLSGSLSREMQEMALEQFCGMLLMAENIENCLRVLPPRKFVPALCGIFLDPTAPERVLEITARAITYYLEFDVGCVASCLRTEEEAIRAICNNLVISSDGANKALVEQCIKVLEYICMHIHRVVFAVGGFDKILAFIKNFGEVVHRDILHSAISAISSSCRSMDPVDFETVCLEDLSALLLHQNERVANGALDSFYLVAFKFDDRKRDPTEIAKYGLLNALLLRLNAISALYATSSQDTASNAGAADSNSKIISKIFRTLMVLCQRSTSITQELLRSNFLDVIEQILKPDEISVLDAIKFIDTLLVVLCENREKEDEKKSVYSKSPEELFSEIIECVRMEDFDTFADYLEKYYFDLDYTDSFGQTLMNWASAIGTHEMVQFLCRKGADINKGEHGSSLHYATAAGKVNIVKVLLSYGANKNSPDENGKTPVHRAQEGGTDDHKAVVSLLEFSHHGLIIIRKSYEPRVTTESHKMEGNSEIVAVYLTRLLPVFCTVFQSSTIESVRKATINSMKSMVKYITADTLKELCASGNPNFAYQVAETVVAVLNYQGSHNTKLKALKVTKRLIKKCEEIFLDVFIRLGMVRLVQNLATPETPAAEEVAVVPAAEALEDATEILPETAYHWHHWCVCLGSNGFYVWCESVTLEFCNNSNGWFRYFINGELHTIYSCGRIEDGSSHNALDFLIKFNTARKAVKNASTSIPILSNPGTTSLIINNWWMVSPVESEMHVQNLENPQQKTTLPVSEHGFKHESDNGSKYSFTSKRDIVLKVAGGWLKKPYNARLPTDKELIIKRKIRLANCIYENYFKTAHVQRRPIMVKLENVVDQLKSGSSDVALKEALDELTQILVDNETINNFEFRNSGLIQALLLLFEQKRHIQLFRQCFEENSINGNNMFAALVQKLVSVLESSEKLPVYLYSASSSLLGMSILKNTVRLRLQREAGEDHLIDRTNEQFQVEPLSTVRELEEFLLKMVIKTNSSNAADAPQEGNFIVSEPTAASGSDAVPESVAISVYEAVPEFAVVSASVAVPEAAPVEIPESVPISASDAVQVSTSDQVPELGISSLQLRVVAIVTSGIEEDTPASAVPSGSREVVDLPATDTVQTVTAEEMEIAYGTRSVPESAVASGSHIVDRTREQHPRTILERMLTASTDGRSNISSGLRASHSRRYTNSTDSYDSSDDEELNNGVPKFNRRFILTGQFPALLPGFDPRPGRFVNPTTDLEVLPPGVEEFTITSKDNSQSQRKLKLILKTNATYFIDIPVELELTDGNYTIFRAMRELVQLSKLQLDRQINQIWNNQYKIVYSELKDDDLPSKPPPPSNLKVGDILQLLKHLFVITTSKKISSSLALTADQFLSKKINNKVLQQLKDVLIMSTSSTPAWFEELNRVYSFLFPFETRQLYFQITAFGTVRTVMWFQAQEILAAERARTSNTQQGAHRINSQFGQLKTERIKVPRGPTFLEWAMQVLKMHCDRKAKLEIQFIGEEGTGLGPTLEFYTLTATKLQQRDLAMWICDDFHLLYANPQENITTGESSKTPDFYVRNRSGLFPAPLPQDSKLCDEVVKYFWVLGILLAKVLQDNRLVDLPLSKSFLKLMCNSNTGTSIDKQKPWYQNILGLSDLYDIDPVRAEFLKEIRKLVKQKTAIMQDTSLSSESKAAQIQNLKVKHTSGPISLEDLALNFTYAPSSKIFGFSAMELVPNGADIEVTIENIEEYSNLTLSFALEKGIDRQLKAFHQGFCEVFPMEKLAAFSQNELRIMLCGDQNPQWTKEDLINYTEPKLGYTKESPGFLRFVNVLMDISPEEKKAFVQFATGCSSLPPGGLANLYPRLTIVKKVDSGEGSYPSVNTCVHYLKLPEYSTEEILKERLLVAIKQTGFYFN